MDKPLEGGCLCGSVRYQISGQPFDADYCHCRQCQKSTGSIVGVWMDFKTTEIHWIADDITFYSSSEKIRRGFCGNCGCSISYQHLDYPEYFTLTIATLDNPDLVRPRYHIYTGERVSWLTIEDECPRFIRNRG